MTLFYWIFAGSVICWILFEIWVNLRDKGKLDNSRDKKTKRLVIACIIFAIFIGNIFSNIPFLLMPLSNSLRFIFGTLIVWSGLLLRFWSIRVLGEYFRTTVMIQKDHQVVKAGPYRLIRHPSYAAGLIIIIGISLAMGSWIGLLLMFLLVAIAYQKRIAVEESELLKSLGKEYLDYMKSTKRLIPFIY